MAELPPGRFSTIVQNYHVVLGVPRRGDLPSLTDSVPIDGLATLTINYL
jgi:hypothetical protein